jgi:hypothetical protein
MAREIESSCTLIGTSCKTNGTDTPASNMLTVIYIDTSFLTGYIKKSRIMTIFPIPINTCSPYMLK